MSDQAEHFEMRRLEALSNTIFGVAMTLLAYDLPKAAQFVSAPVWSDIFNAYAEKMAVMMVSFAVAGAFWFSHHRRLIIAPKGGRGTVVLNLLFLMSIIVLPATNGLYGAHRQSSVVTVIYGVHLMVAAALNALLWLIALKGRDHHQERTTAIFPVFVFALGTAVAFIAPSVSLFIWFLGFAAPLAGWLTARRQDRGPGK